MTLLWLACRHRRALTVTSHLTLRERAVLYSLARTCPRNARICEIGSFVGASACALAAGIVDARIDAQLTCIDTWRNDAMTEGRRDTWEEFHRNTVPFNRLVRPVRGRSQDVANFAAQQAGAPWSLIFFDGDHSDDGVHRDWNAYEPHLGPQATVVFHDIGWAEGVQRLVKETVTPRLAWWRSLPNLFWGKLT